MTGRFKLCLVTAVFSLGLFAICGVVAGDYALAANLSPEQQKLITAINKRYYKINSLAGDFIQVAPDGSRSKGRIYMQKPGKIRFYYHKPSTLDIISDGSDLVIKNRRDNSQDRYDLADTPLYSLLDNKSELIDIKRVKTIYSDSNYVTVIIREKIAGDDGEFVLTFDTNKLDLSQWSVIDAQGKETSVSIYNLRKGVSFARKMFEIDRYNVKQEDFFDR